MLIRPSRATTSPIALSVGLGRETGGDPFFRAGQPETT